MSDVGCLLNNPSDHSWAYYVPMLIFESILFLLAIAKACQTARQEWHTPKILVVLLRDSVVYFGGVLAIILTNLVIIFTARVRFASLPPSFGCL